MNKGKAVHQGKLFKQLVLRSGKTRDAIEKLTGITRQWQNKLFQNETLTEKNIALIVSGLKIDPEYFSGKVELPDRSHFKVNDPQETYGKQTNCRELEIKYTKLLEDYNKSQRDIIDLQSKLLEQKKHYTVR